MPSVENLLGLTLQKCSNPVRIVDKTHGGYMYVDCGHCVNCQSAMRNKWAQRLDLERQGSASTLFFTLTYSNENIPHLMLDITESYLVSNRTLDDNLYITDENRHELDALVPLQSRSGGYIPYTYSYVCKSDYQKFLKRLRRQLEYDKLKILQNVPQENRKFRYFLATEYGPKTYRAHAHGLLFFSDVSVSNAVRDHYIYEAWKLCSKNNLRCETLFGAGSSYVSKYVNKSSSVPYLLRQPTTDTFYLASKCPAIGCGYLNIRDTADMLSKRDYTYNKQVVDKAGCATSVSMQLPKQIASYYFPRCYDFVHLTRHELCKIYGSKINFKNLNKYPSLLREVARKYNLHSYNEISKRSYSAVYHNMLDDEILYGIPQNRLAANRAYLYCQKYNISIENYVDDLITYHSSCSSQSYGMFVDWLNDHKLNIPTLVSAYPASFDNLPLYLDDLVVNSYTEPLNSLLNSAGFTLCDLYGNDNKLIPLSCYSYNNDKQFIKYCDVVLQKNHEFETKRVFAHINNQLNYNYETF